jgi:hypothetical protein
MQKPNKQLPVVTAIETLLGRHGDWVWQAYLITGTPRVIFSTIGEYFYIDSDEDDLHPTTEQLIETAVKFSDIINVSRGMAEWTENYAYTGTVRNAYLENKACVFAAGNWGLYQFASKNSKTGYESESGFKYISSMQSSPYDFTVGAMRTFRWNEENTVERDGKKLPTKTAIFELADFSDCGPKFVDFYTYGDSGTSFAAPMVAGLISRIKEDHPEYTLNQIRTVLERNSKPIKFTKTDHGLGSDFKFTWIAQVLDPYNLEKNLIRNGKLGSGQRDVEIELVTPEIKITDYTWTFDTTHRIDKHTKVDAMFEIFLGENPSTENLNRWITIIDEENLTVSQAVKRFTVSTLFDSLVYMDAKPEIPEMALIERVQALYHLGLGREPSLEETVMAIDHYSATGENFRDLIIDFVGHYNVDLATQTWG